MLATKYVHGTWHFMSNDLNLPHTQINIRRQRNIGKIGNVRVNNMAIQTPHPFAWGIQYKTIFNFTATNYNFKISYITYIHVSLGYPN
jgi:hypothetical protein